MELDKKQKLLLMLIIFFSIVFAFELQKASAVQKEEVKPLKPAKIDLSYSEIDNSTEKVQNQTNEKEIDYGRPLPLPSEYEEQEESSSGYEQEPPDEGTTPNESDKDGPSGETNETTPDENQTNESEENQTEENETQINETEPVEPDHDLGIAKLELTPDPEKPLRVEIKIQVKNHGKEKENNLKLLRKIGNKTKEYGPYDDEITYSSTRNYQKTFSEPGEYNVTFRIMNYTSFGEDSNSTNNIKTASIYLE